MCHRNYTKAFFAWFSSSVNITGKEKNTLKTYNINIKQKITKKPKQTKKWN